MKTYRIKLEPMGRFITPFQADTLWGHFCWIVRWREGEKALKEFITAFEKEPPFVLSDGFPGDLLPVPLHLPMMVHDGDERIRFKTRKALKELSWLTLEEFMTVQKGVLPTITEGERAGFLQAVTLHSSISRLTGTTGEEGSLFEIEEQALEADRQYVSVYVRVSDSWEDRVWALFQDIGKMGYGKKRSIGFGAMKVLEPEPFAALDSLANANGFTALSNFVPSSADPVAGHYKTFVKYGKLGGEYAFTGKSFKRPVMMLRAGSSFSSETVKPYYGKMIKNVLPEMPEVVQYGYTLAVPIRLPVRFD